MISFIVARIVRRTYEQLNRQEVDAALKGFKPDARFIFSGTHALGTDIRGTDMIKRWFERAYRLVPDVHFDVHDVLVRGGPWNMRVVSYFTVTGTLAGEREYRNKGMQMLHLKWGKVVEDFILEDTQRVAEGMSYLAQKGVSEAAQPGIGMADAGALAPAQERIGSGSQ